MPTLTIDGSDVPVDQDAGGIYQFDTPSTGVTKDPLTEVYVTYTPGGGSAHHLALRGGRPRPRSRCRARPTTEDLCGPDNIEFVVPADTDQVDWTLLQNGNVTVEPKDGYKFEGNSQLVTFTLPADTNEECPESDEEIPVPAEPVDDRPVRSGQHLVRAPRGHEPGRLTWSSSR